jgi:L-fuconolactonase
MPRIDAHHHLWNLSEVEMTWLNEDYGPVYASFETEELAPKLRAADIDKTVLVQSSNSYEGTAYLLKLSDYTDWVGAVVGWVDLLNPEDTRRRLEMYRKHPKFRGINHLLSIEDNPDWVAQPVVIDSLKVAEEMHVVFEVSAVYPFSLKHVAALAEALPNLTLIINHLGKPPISERKLSPWTDQLALAAAHPNVYAKISGLNTAANWETWNSEDLKPYIDFAIEIFGADRLMAGSDWPICTLAGSYQAVWVETLEALDSHSKSTRDAILGGTAAKVYNI